MPGFIKLVENPHLLDFFPDFCSVFQHKYLPYLIQDASPDSPLLKAVLPTSYPPQVSATAKIIKKQKVTVVNPILPCMVDGMPCTPPRSNHHWISTGFYAKQGELVTVTVPKNMTGKFSIQIGTHDDNLFEKNRKKWKEGKTFIRPAEITQYYDEEIIKEKTRVLAPYGGLIYISVPQFNLLGDFNLEFENVIESPTFVHGVSTNKTWQESFERSGAPMVELEVPGLIITIPSRVIKKLKPDMEKVAAQWKLHMDAIFDLLGYKQLIPERYATDVEISIGGEHAGYPMMCGGADTTYHIDVREGSLLMTGQAWGIFHEIGHNRQDNRWTPSGLGEVTNNIMAEYVQETVYDFHAEGSDSTYTEAFRKGGKKFEKLGPWEFLNVFMIVKDECGWDAFKKFFRYYNKNFPGRLSPNTKENKYSTIAKVLSLSCNKNLIPYFQWWNWPLLDDAIEETSNLPTWDNAVEMLDNSVKKCTGNHHRWWKDCCNEEDPCGEGEGHCANNGECEDGMRCGTGNCDLTTKTFLPSDNCCSASVICDGGDSCCTEERPCGVGEGDCDKDSECKGTAKCGSNNCKNLNTTNTFDSGDDCCYDPANP